MSVQSLLKNAYLFKDLTDKDVDQIAKICEVKGYGPGEDVFSQGDSATSMYVVKMGSVKIMQKGRSGEDVPVGNLGSGSLFGEMSFIDGETRSATISVTEKTEIITIPYMELINVLKSNDRAAITFFMAMSKFLCNRLRVTTTDLSFAKEKNIRHF